MEKEHKTFLEEKKSKIKKRERMIEMLTKERDTLQDRLDAIQQGAHAKQDSKVSEYFTKHQDHCILSMNRYVRKYLSCFFLLFFFFNLIEIKK